MEMSPRIGNKIRIIEMDNAEGKDPAACSYNGKSGTITHIDDAGQLHGTWGALAVIPEIDKFEIIKER